MYCKAGRNAFCLRRSFDRSCLLLGTEHSAAPVTGVEVRDRGPPSRPARRPAGGRCRQKKARQ